MPQLDFSIYFPQIFWFIIVFGLFFGLSYFFIIPRLNLIKKTRDSILDENLKISQDNNAKIKELEDKINKLKSQANHDVAKIFNDVEKKIQMQQSQSLSDLDDSFRKKLKQINDDFDLKIKNVSAEIKPQTDKIVSEIVTKLK